MSSRLRVIAIVVSMLSLLALAGWTVPARAQTTGSVSITATPNAGQVPLAVSFSATISCNCTPALDWDFGDGSVHAYASPVTHTYEMAGAYTCILTVKDASSGSLVGTDSARILAWQPLSVVASQAPDRGPAPLTVNFTGQAFGGVPPYRFQWDFGDGTATTTTQNPTHTYSAPPVRTSRCFKHGTAREPGPRTPPSSPRSRPHGHSTGAWGSARRGVSTS